MHSECFETFSLFFSKSSNIFFLLLTVHDAVFDEQKDISEINLGGFHFCIIYALKQFQILW